MSTLDEMWMRLAEHQPIADERGYGAEWNRMCEQRTYGVAQAAAWAAASAAASAAAMDAWAAAWAAASAAFAAGDAAEADAEAKRWAEKAVKRINQDDLSDAEEDER